MIASTAVQRVLVLGLLGAPGSGKSHVAAAFAGHGAAVIDADALAREALEVPAVREQLRQWWGDGVIQPDGTTDRAAVGRRVFQNPDELRRLEGLIHPEVKRRRAALHERYRADPGVNLIVEDSPLLLESGLDSGCDALVYVEADEATRRARVAEHRGWSAEELTRREKLQWPLDTKRGRADYVVANGAGHPDVSARVLAIIDRVRADPARGAASGGGAAGG